MIHVFDLDGTLLEMDHSVDWEDPVALDDAVKGPIAKTVQHAEWLRDTTGGSIYVLTARRSLQHRTATLRHIEQHIGWPPGSYVLLTMPALDFDWFIYNDFKHQVLALIKTFDDVTYYGDNASDEAIARSAGVSYFHVSEL